MLRSGGSGDNLDDHVCHTGNDGMRSVFLLLGSYKILPYSTKVVSCVLEGVLRVFIGLK